MHRKIHTSKITFVDIYLIRHKYSIKLRNDYSICVLVVKHCQTEYKYYYICTYSMSAFTSHVDIIISMFDIIILREDDTGNIY